MTSPLPVAFLGGNGHCAARLAAARRHLAGLDLDEVPYPGFEGRPRAESLDGFLAAISSHLQRRPPALAYATGIGGLLALCLRARGELSRTPLLLQAPVLWGLERRWMPRVMRPAPARRALVKIFAAAAFQRRFLGMYFTHPPPPETARAFFDGYARCAAAVDLFAWCSPALLRALERDLAGSLEQIRVWWGGLDRVVDRRELAWTEDALGLQKRWPVRVFPAWGHYPMIDDPAGWAGELAGAVAEAGAV